MMSFESVPPLLVKLRVYDPKADVELIFYWGFYALTIFMSFNRGTDWKNKCIEQGSVFEWVASWSWGCFLYWRRKHIKYGDVCVGRWMDMSCGMTEWLRKAPGEVDVFLFRIFFYLLFYIDVHIYSMYTFPTQSQFTKITAPSLRSCMLHGWFGELICWRYNFAVKQQIGKSVNGPWVCMTRMDLSLCNLPLNSTFY